MPAFDALLFNKKGSKKTLTLILDENDDILGSIKQGMKEHNIQEGRIDDMQGVIREGVGSFMSGHNFRTINFASQEIIRASGNYKLSFDELFGSMNVTTAGRKPVTATFVKGKAGQGLQITLGFVEIEP